MKPLHFIRSAAKWLLPVLLFLLIMPGASAQMREVYRDAEPLNELRKLNFYSPSTGYTAFRDWIGFTTDSGRSYAKKRITLSNVDYSGYPVNLTFGFGINGVVGFDQNNLIAYGVYGATPAILTSGDGGNTFKVRLYSILAAGGLSRGIQDMQFPQNGNIGYAIDEDRILKSTDRGINWSMVAALPGTGLVRVQAIDANNVIAYSDDYYEHKLVKTSNGGATWQAITYPSMPKGRLVSAYFLTANTGWLNLVNDKGQGGIYKTTNGGTSWTLVNDPLASSYGCRKMYFADEQTGYGLSGLKTVFKTTDGGAIWEPLPVETNFSYLYYGFNDLQGWSATQVWAGGGGGQLELTTNGGGTPLPIAYMKADTVGLDVTGTVQLRNYSRTSYQSDWYLNNQHLGSSYHSSYSHDPYRTRDTIMLIVTSGNTSDTARWYQEFHPPIIIQSFTPTAAATGQSVVITGTNFLEVNGVYFGGVPAAWFAVESPTRIVAGVADGASGAVVLTSPINRGQLNGFTFIPPPTLSGFLPAAATAGTTMTITGTNLTGANSVTFAGVHASSFTVVSATEIRAVVPSGSSGYIEVVTPGGYASLDNYIALPVLADFTPKEGTQGSIITVTGTSLSDIATASVGGVAATIKSASANSLTIVVGTGASGSVAIGKPGGTANRPGFTWYPPPVITAVSPASGPVGTVVTITGTGFNAAAADNRVDFGGVRATITAASTTMLKVTVPAGASYNPIKVTSNKLVGYSAQPFVVTFANGGSITTASFSNTTVINSWPHAPIRPTQCDLDGDGNVDLIVPNYNIDNAAQGGFLIYRNNSVTGNISFQSPIPFYNGDGRFLAVGDIDGDGKAEIVVPRGDSLLTYRNVSSSGTIVFQLSHKLLLETPCSGIAIQDMDSDGKADVVVNGPQTTIYRNISNPNAIAYDDGRSTAITGGGDIALADFNGDGRVDMIGSSVLMNESVKGNIRFGQSIGFVNARVGRIAVGDFDNDGKIDIAATLSEASRIVVVRNTSLGGAVSFAEGIEFPAYSTPDGIAVADMDGDGLVDIGVNLINNSLALYKNGSTAGNISFALKVDYRAGRYQNNFLLMADIDGDGKNDAIATSETGRTITVHRNTVKPEPFVESFTPTWGETGTVVTILGNNFTGATSVSFGGVAATSFTIVSDKKITTVLSVGATGDVAVSNSLGTSTRAGFIFGRPPVITGLSPAAGNAGSTITISGERFDPVATNNIVYFGRVRATVMGASGTSLSVKVPAGAGYLPVSVTVKGKTAWSAACFNTTFSGADAAYSEAALSMPYDRIAGRTGVMSDIDGDGKPDLLVPANTSGIVIARNTSEMGNISLSANTTLPVGADVSGLTTGDLDGDGLQDILSWHYESSTMAVIRNKSTPGNISLSIPVRLPTGESTTRPVQGALQDIDLDGKPDVIVANYSMGVVVFHNESLPGTITLGPRIDFPVARYPVDMVVKDLDGDGKPDMVVIARDGTGQTIVVYHNTSVPGDISFIEKQDLLIPSYITNVQVGDVDADGRFDVITAGSNGILLHRNLSTPGSLSFETPRALPAGSSPAGVSLGDVDGDGKVDVIAGDNSPGSFLVLKNTSSGGTVSFQQGVRFVLSKRFYGAETVDVDVDGVTDLVVYGDYQTSIFRTIIGTASVVSLCSESNTTLEAGVTGNGYQWQRNAGAGFVNLADNANISGATQATLQLINVPYSWNMNELRCMVNGVQGGGIKKLVITQSVKPAVGWWPSAYTFCEGTEVILTASHLNGGDNPSYQWKINNTPVGTNNKVFITTALRQGDTVRVDMTSSIACPIPAKVTSTPFAPTVNATSSAIRIDGPTTVQQGYPITIEAALTNGGPLPQIQWQDSTEEHSWKDVGGRGYGVYFSYTPEKTGVKLRAQLYSNAPCMPAAPVVSNVLQFTIKVITAVGPEPASGYGIRAYPNPAINKLVIDSLRLTDLWETVTVNGVDGRFSLPLQKITGKTSVALDVHGLPRGHYVATLKRKHGAPVFLRFMKL